MWPLMCGMVWYHTILNDTIVPEHVKAIFGSFKSLMHTQRHRVWHRKNRHVDLRL